jgi:hypothetical protein
MNIRHRVTGVIGAVVAAAGVVVAPSGGANADQAYGIPDATPRPIFTSTAGNRCLQVGPADNYFLNNARIQQWTCSGAPEQQWSVNAYATANLPSGLATLYQIKNQRSGMCMEVRSGGANAYVHADMDQTYCGTGSVGSMDSQLWLVTGAPDGVRGPWTLNPWSAVSRGSTMCVDVANASGNNGAWITQYFCNGTNAQRFTGDGLFGRISLDDPVIR